MIYVRTITTPAATSESVPLETRLKVSKGIMYQAECMFPPGPSGLVGVRCLVQNVAFFPSTREEWLIGDAVTISFPDLREFVIDGNEIVIQTYNTDDTYEHLIQLRFGIVSRRDFIERFLPGSALESLNAALSPLVNALAETQVAADLGLVQAIGES